VALRTTLAKFPGCVHWHLKLGREPGTLEVTFWPDAGRLWFTVHERRGGRWIEGKMKELAAKLRGPW
jgi:hypothetical protein